MDQRTEPDDGVLTDCQRRRPRMAGRVPVRMKCSDGTALGEACTINLSAGGAALRLADAAPVAARPPVDLELEIELDPDAPPLSVRASVVWTQGVDVQRGSAGRLGVRFVDLDERARDTLLAWLLAQRVR